MGKVFEEKARRATIERKGQVTHAQVKRGKDDVASYDDHDHHYECKRCCCSIYAVYAVWKKKVYVFLHFHH